MDTSVQVPGSLLLHPDLSPAAKLLWMIHRLCTQTCPAPITHALLQARSGLSWHTVRAGLATLQARGLAPSASPAPSLGPDPGQAALPDDLLLDRRIHATSKLLYGALQPTPAYLDETTRATWAELAAHTGLSHSTVKRTAQALRAAGWLDVAQRNKFAAIQFTLRNPAAEGREAEAGAAERRLARAEFKGEALMREYLSLIIGSRDFEDNATPGFLINPLTGEEMQLDRFYPPGVALEYNGPQHYGPTDLYPSDPEARKQRSRDLMKKALCAERGITLVVVHPEDLTLQRLRQMTDGLLPHRSLDGHEPLIAYLESVSRRYRRKARAKTRPAP